MAPSPEALARHGELDAVAGLESQVSFYQRALELESDYAVRASLNSRLRNLLAAHGRLPQALAVA